MEKEFKYFYFLKYPRTNSNIYPKAEIIEQKVHVLQTDDCRCDFTIDQDLEKNIIPIDEILKVMENSNKFTTNGRTDFFSILSDTNGQARRFCFHLKYSQ